LPILTQKGCIPGMSARYTEACPPSPTAKMGLMSAAAQVGGPTTLGCTNREAGRRTSAATWGMAAGAPVPASSLLFLLTCSLALLRWGVSSFSRPAVLTRI